MKLTSTHKKQILASVIFIVTFSATTYLFKPKPTFDKQLLEASQEMNQHCPLMVDSETRLDNTVVLPGKTFAYNYTLINISVDDMDVAIFKDSLQPIVLNLISTSDDMKIMRDNDTTFNYIYKDKDGKQICKIVITPDMYK